MELSERMIVSIPKANLSPPFNITRCSHAEWGVTDLDYARDFYINLLGYICEDDFGETIYLRGMEERNHHSLILTKANKPVVFRLAFKVAEESDLDQAAAFYNSIGCKTLFVEKYAQGRTLHVSDPFDIPLEFYCEMEHRELLLQQYDRYRGAHIQRIDHFNLFSNNVNAMTSFYVESLGFRPTEVTMTDSSDDNSDLWASWIQRRGGVHDIAFTNGLGPRLHHIGVYVPTAMDIIHFCDRLASSEHHDAFERGPGRHGISNAFFLYLIDRDGHRIELFTGDYVTVDVDHPTRKWDLNDNRRQTLWGQAAPKSWFEQGMCFNGITPLKTELRAAPIVAPE